jgi:HEAT repeat protein
MCIAKPVAIRYNAGWLLRHRHVYTESSAGWSVKSPQGSVRRRVLGVQLMLRTSLIAACLACLPLSGFAAERKLDAILLEMETQGAAFDPAALNELGMAGLEALFDHWLPQSQFTASQQPTAEQVRKLVSELASEDFVVRKAAEERLTLFGDQARPQVVEASKSGDPEVRLRATSILEAWKKQRERPQSPEERQRDTNLRDACGVYLAQIEDGPRLAAFLQRTRLALDVGLQPHGSRAKLRMCLRRVAAMRDDAWCAELKPLLLHDDPQVPLFVIHSIGAMRQNDYLPQLTLEALSCGRPEVVEAALSWTLNCADEQKLPELRERLSKLLAEGEEPLKFQACWPLLKNFRDAEALTYLLEQLRSDDSAHVRTALGWLGDEVNRGQAATPEIVAALSPLLSSEDFFLRRDAAQALAVFQGEEVVARLIPLLIDDKPALAIWAAEELSGKYDRETKQKLLRAAAEKHESTLVREAAAQALKKSLDQPKAP